MTRVASWLAMLYVILLPVGRSGLPVNAQWGDAVLPLLAIAVLRGVSLGSWFRREDWPLGAYLAATLGAALVSADKATGLTHLAKQLSVALVFVVFRRLAPDPELTRRLQKAFVGIMVLVAAISIIALLLRGPGGSSLPIFAVTHTLPTLGRVERLVGGYETPEMLGNALVVAFAIALGFRAMSATQKRPFWTAVAASLAVAEFLTFSHSVAGFAVTAALSAGVASSARRWRGLAWAGAVSVVLVVNAASVIDPMSGDLGADYSVGPVSLDVMGRRVEGRLIHYAALKEVGWLAFLDHPIAGVGPGRFPVETERAFQEGRLTARYRLKPPHCDLTGRLAETGIVGGASLLLLWTFWVRAVRGAGPLSSPLRRAAWTAVMGILVNSLNADVMNFRFLWLALAWASTQDQDAPGNPRSFTRS